MAARPDRPAQEKVRSMVTETDIRKIALGLDGVSEVDHWGRPSWRT